MNEFICFRGGPLNQEWNKIEFFKFYTRRIKKPEKEAEWLKITSHFLQNKVRIAPKTFPFLL